MKIMMLFPGYASQFVGIGKELYDQHRLMQEYFEEASSCLNLNFVKLCFASSDSELSKIQNSYPILFLLSTAIAALLKQEGIRPDVYLGYCDGQMSAISAGGGISMPDGLYFFSKYTTFYQELLKEYPFKSYRIKGMDRALLESVCSQISIEKQPLYIGLYYGNDDHVIIGHKEAIEKFFDSTSQMQLSSEYVGVGIGLHSAVMAPLVKMLKMYLEKIDFRSLTNPYMSAIDARLIVAGPDAKKDSIDHILFPLHYDLVLDASREYGIIIEVGALNPLGYLLKKRYPDAIIMSVKQPQDIKKLKALLSQHKET